MTTARNHPGTKPSEIRDVLLENPAEIKDVQLLVLLLGTGTARHGRGRTRKTWTAIELATDLMAGVGGRLEHLVDAVRRQDFDLHHFGLGKMLGGRLIAAMELAHRWRRGFRNGGRRTIRGYPQFDLMELILERRANLRETELIAIAMTRFHRRQREVGAILKNYTSPAALIRSLTPQVLTANLYPDLDIQERDRLYAAVELARRHRAREGTERFELKPGDFGLSSRYLLKLLSPGSPLDLAKRRSLLDKARSNPNMASDFVTLKRLLRDARAEDYWQAIALHVKFEALRQNREWDHPAEVLGDTVPYAALLAIAEAKMVRSGRQATRVLRVKELLEVAEQAAASGPVAECVEALRETGLSEAGMERALVEARRGYLENVD